MINPMDSRHNRGAVLFSGGKESVVLAHILYPYRDRLELIWVNTGAMLPHMEAFIRGYAKDWKLTELKSDQPSRLKNVGLPSRIIPVFNTPLGRMSEREPKARAITTDWVSCCGDLRGRPITNYLQKEDIFLLIHGQKKSDGVFIGADAPETLAPLWDWTDAQVFDYIKEHGLNLPDQYATYTDSVECWNCTAEVNPKRFEYLRTKYPDNWELLKPMLADVYGAVIDAFEKLRPGLLLAIEGKVANEAK